MNDDGLSLSHLIHRNEEKTYRQAARFCCPEERERGKVLVFIRGAFVWIHVLYMKDTMSLTLAPPVLSRNLAVKSMWRRGHLKLLPGRCSQIVRLWT